jgi:hypothetical protein
MNDGSSQRSPLSSYRMAKADDESDQSEKVSMIDKDVKPSIDTAPAKIPVPNAKESIKGDKISPFPSHGAVTGNPDLAKALLGGEELSADFDMSMVPMAFPQRLHEMVTNEDNSTAIAWLPHGKGFVINDKKEFSKRVLPKYFKESKFTSFTRKLNRWGFTRVARGSESGAYYHPHFQKDNIRRTLLMTCNNRATVAKKNASNPAAAATTSATNSNIGGNIDQAIQEAAIRQMLQLDQRNSTLQSRHLGDQTVDKLNAQLLLRQEQQQLAKLEELRTAQNQQLNNSEAALQRILAQIGASALQNSLYSRGGETAEPSLTPHQQLLAQLGASSSLRNQPLGGASTSLNYPSTSSPTAALESAVAAFLGSPVRQNPLARASVATASVESNVGSNQQSSLLNAVSNLQRTDPSAYMALLLAQQKAQNQANSFGQLLNQEGGRAQQNLLLQAQQQKLNELLQMRAQQEGAQSQQGQTQQGDRKEQGQSPMLPPKKR